MRGWWSRSRSSEARPDGGKAKRFCEASRLLRRTAVVSGRRASLRSTATYKSALRELRAATGAAQTVLLPLLHAGVAGEVPGVAELLHHARGRVGRGRGSGRR